MLKGVVIENYRSCLRTAIDLHPNLSILIGPNGSGKTNILQGIMLLSQIARGQEHAAGLARLTTTSRLRMTFKERDSAAELKASVNTFTNESNQDVILGSRQRWLFKGPEGQRFKSLLPLAVAGRFLSPNELLNRDLDLTSRIYVSYASYALRLGKQLSHDKMPKWVTTASANVAKYCLGMRYYGASQFTNPGTCPASFEIEREGSSRSLHRIRGHAKILYGMYAASRATPNSKYDEFMQIVGPHGLRLIDGLTFRQVRSGSTEYSVRVGGKVERRRRENLLIIPQFKIGRQILSPNQLSEGTFKTLALLFHVITENSSALLIEEPEVCVHQGLLSSILDLIKTYSSDKQMILSTHSDYVLDHVKPENVYQVQFNKAQGTIARHIRKTMSSREFGALRQYLEREGNLGEYWREGGLGDQP